MQTLILQCFGTNTESGNLAMVIINDNLTSDERLSFAKQQNLPACVFMHNVDAETITLDYYYPHAQSPLCLHGTLAAGYIYFRDNPKQNKVNVITKMQQHLLIERDNENIFVTIAEHKTPSIKVSNKSLQELLNISNSNIIIQANIASVGSPKLLIEVNDLSALYNLTPNLELIRQFSIANNINGCYVYFRQNNIDIIGRNFNHLDPSHEDSATGVAAAALSCYYKMDLNVYQGMNLNNPCVINTKYTNDRIFIGGTVRLCVTT